MTFKKALNGSTQTLYTDAKLATACAACSLRELCIAGGIPATDLAKLDALVTMRKRVKRGNTLFSIGDEFRALFAVRTGFFKTSIASNDGRDQITGFQVPGELLGLEGLATAQHGVNATALEDSEVCVLLYNELERIARDFAPLQHQLHRVMSREITREHSVILLLGTMKAEERVAAFLLNLAERYRHLGYSSNELVLRMTRQEIGSYLGLKLETVSRCFSKFQDQGLITVQGKNIKLLDQILLRQAVNSSTN